MFFILIALFFGDLPLFELKDTIYSFARLDSKISNFNSPYHHTVNKIQFHQFSGTSSLFILKGTNYASPSIGGTSPEENAVYLYGIPMVNPMLGYQDLSAIPLSTIEAIEIIHSSSPLNTQAGIGGTLNFIPHFSTFQISLSDLRRSINFSPLETPTLKLNLFYEDFAESYDVVYEGVPLRIENSKDSKVGYFIKFHGFSHILIKRKAGAPSPVGGLSNGEKEEFYSGLNFNNDRVYFQTFYSSQLYTSTFSSDVHRTIFVNGAYKIRKDFAGFNLYGANSTKVGQRLIPEIYLKGHSILLSKRQLSIAINYNLIYSFKFYGITPLLSLNAVSQPKENLFLFLILSRNKRNPTLNELFWPEDQFARGNQELKPEISYNVDFGVRRVGPKHYLSIILFAKYLKNGILWIQEDKYTPKNFAEIFHRGLSINLALNPIDYLYIEGNANLQKSTVNGNPFIYRAPLTFDIQMQIKNLTLQFFNISKRPERPSGTKMLESVKLLNIALEKEFNLFSFNQTFSIGVENLLNQNYELVRGYPQPGREFFVRVKINRRDL